MAAGLGLIASMALVSIAIGALIWVLGDDRRGKRAIAFGIVLGVVGETLARNGEVLLVQVCAHRVELVVLLIGLVLILALLRIAWSARVRSREQKTSQKRRVQGGP